MSPAKVLDKNGNVVSVGDKVTNFRGETGIFQGVTRMPTDGRSPKISVDGREYFVHVYDLYIEEIAE